MRIDDVFCAVMALGGRSRRPASLQRGLEHFTQNMWALVNSGSRQSGFTLLEVLVALTILSLGLAAILISLSTGVRYQVEAQQEVQATALAQSLLARTQADPAAKLGVTSGQSADGLSWEIVESRSDANEAGPVEAVDVVAKVSWLQDSTLHAVSLHTLRLIPRAALR